MALLTPKDIRNFEFHMVRFQEGYKTKEVDDFLDQVAETVEALSRQAMQNVQSTQTLSPDVAGLNTKIATLTDRVRELESEKESLQAAVHDAQQASHDGQAASDEQAALLSGLEENNRTLTSQNEQLKSEVDRLSEQLDVLTAQAAQAAGNDEAAKQALEVTQRERDELRAQNTNLANELEQVRTQLGQALQDSNELVDVRRQLDESRQREEQLRVQLQKLEPNTETGSLQKIAGAGAFSNTEPERATAMLTLAMQLHDQYVDKGKAKAREITEASQQRYDELIAQANDYSTRTRSEADDYSQRVHADADTYSNNTHTEADAYSDHTRHEADEYAAQTRSEADDYSAQTHQDAEDYAANTRAGADRYEQEVHNRAAEYDTNTRQAADTYAQQVHDNLEHQTRVVEGNIQGLKQFETEYRARLTDFLGQLLAQVSESNNYNQVSSPAHDSSQSHE